MSVLFESGSSIKNCTRGTIVKLRILQSENRTLLNSVVSMESLETTFVSLTMAIEQGMVLDGFIHDKVFFEAKNAQTVFILSV